MQVLHSPQQPAIKNTMQINREKFWNVLERVKHGLSTREFIEQSSCYVFKDGHVMTFNDEVACRMKLDEETVGGNLNITGAIQATALLSILEKMNEEHLEVLDSDNGQVEFRGKRRRFGIVRESEVFLPIDKVEKPDTWQELSRDFTEAVGLVSHCVSTDDAKFLLTCIHIHPDYIEACDNLQILRVDTKTKIKSPILVRGTSLASITSLGMDSFSVTKSWIHFKNHEGLVLSCRAYREDYPDLEKMMKVEGSSIVIPKGLKEAAECAAVFGVDRAGEAQVMVTLRDGKVRIRGEGITGFYEELKQVAYDGPPLQFVIAPDLLKHISEKYKEATLSDSKLMAKGGSWTYITVLGKVEGKEN